MNFITRNLWWLLLLAFFIFMLFVISSNDPQLKNASWALNNTGILSVSTWEIDSENVDDWLQELVDKINSEENISDTDTEKWNDEKIISNESDLVSLEEQSKKQWFFSKIFSRKWKDDTPSDENQSKNEENNDDSEESDSITKDEKMKKQQDSHIVSAVENVWSAKWNLTKKVNMSSESYTLAQKYAPEVLGYTLPGVHLETEIGKIFEVGVYSLKLNNKLFTQKLGYLMKGDSLKQLSSENNYGCFQVEVLDSSVDVNTWKIGYVCKKYLTESSDIESEEKTEEDTVVLPEWPLFLEHTEIWDIIEVKKSDITFGDIILDIGDMLDQMSDLDSQACFTARVHSSSRVESIWKTAKICNRDLY